MHWDDYVVGVLHPVDRQLKSAQGGGARDEMLDLIEERLGTVIQSFMSVRVHTHT